MTITQSRLPLAIDTISGAENWKGGMITFTAEDGDSGWHYFVSMNRDSWESMDSPRAITITVEPGDQLNTAEEIERCRARGIHHPGTNVLGEVVA